MAVIPIYQFHAIDQDPWRYYYSPDRRDSALDNGWTYDGVAFYAYDAAQGSTDANVSEVHRLVAQQNGKNFYFYAIDPDQISSAVSNGWTDEGGSFYAYTGAKAPAGTTRAVYRYTSDSDPFRYLYSLLASLSPTAAPGWVAEGEAFFVNNQDTPDAGNLL